MPEVFILLIFLVFVIFLFMGLVYYFKKVNNWILITFFLSGIMLMTISGCKFADFGTDNKTNISEQGSGSDKNSGNSDTIKNGEEEPSSEGDEDEQTEPDTPTQPEQTEPEASEPAPSTTTDPEPTTPSAPAKISIPTNGTVNYTVLKGDTLWSISQRADITVTKIKQWNKLTSNTIYVGQVLTLYGKNNEPPVNVNPTEPTAFPSALITHGNLQQKEIAFTFDAGSDIAGIQILDILQKYNVKATFFLTGKWVEKYPDYAKRIVNAGHEIGNHSYSHPDAVTISSSTLIQDINRAELIIKTTTGVSPRPYFRFPYGSYNQSALKTVGGAGYPYSIQWSLDTIDWQQPSADVIVSRIEAGASNGDIVLMHIGGINTPEAVDRAIPILQAKGYRLVTLSQVFN